MPLSSHYANPSARNYSTMSSVVVTLTNPIICLEQRRLSIISIYITILFESATQAMHRRIWKHGDKDADVETELWSATFTYLCSRKQPNINS